MPELLKKEQCYKPAGRGFDSRWCQWIFSWHNPVGRTMALWSTQPLTEMSTRNISWGVKAAGAYGWQPTTFKCRLSRNLGASTSWNPVGLSRPVMEVLHLFFFNNYRLLGCDAVWNGKQVLISDSNVLLPSSGPNLKPRAPTEFTARNGCVVLLNSLVSPQMLEHL
jgi:hypothetical protein